MARLSTIDYRLSCRVAHLERSAGLVPSACHRRTCAVAARAHVPAHNGPDERWTIAYGHVAPGPQPHRAGCACGQKETEGRGQAMHAEPHGEFRASPRRACISKPARGLSRTSGRDKSNGVRFEGHVCRATTRGRLTHSTTSSSRVRCTSERHVVSRIQRRHALPRKRAATSSFSGGWTVRVET